MTSSLANRGQFAESVVESLHHNYLLQRRITAALRLGPPGRIVGPIVRGVAPIVLLGPAPPDWLVRLTSGHVLVFDIKSHAGPRWPLAQIEPHQADHLDGFDPGGGNPHTSSAILLCLAGEWWWCPWRGAHSNGYHGIGALYRDWRRDGGRKTRASLTTEDLDSVGTHVGMGDWLGAACLAAGRG